MTVSGAGMRGVGRNVYGGARGRDQDRADRLPALLAVVLHLVPGILILGFVWLAGPAIAAHGLPLILVPSLWVWAVLIPSELGLLFGLGLRRNGRLSLDGIVLNREPMSWRSYAVLVPLLMTWAVFAFLVLAPKINAAVFAALFAWVPGWYAGMFVAPSPTGQTPALMVLAVALYVVSNPAAAFVEELYFRGYLLPRLGPGRWTPLANTVLFCLYHFHSPWQFAGRLLAFTPVAYAVARRQNFCRHHHPLHTGRAVRCGVVSSVVSLMCLVRPWGAVFLVTDVLAPARAVAGVVAFAPWT